MTQADRAMEAMHEMQKEYYKLRQEVRYLREAQREYFKTRNTSALQRAKEMERRIDKMLEETNAAS